MNLEMVSDMMEHSLEAFINFHQIWTSRTQSRVHLSSKSLPRVLEDMEVPNEPGDGVR